MERSTNQRRLIERLSGWRLVAFFVSAILNLGLLATLVWLPWMFNPSQLFVVVALIAGSHAVFLTAVSGFRFAISVKIALAWLHAVACIWALGSIGGLPVVELGGIEVATLYLIPMLTLVVTAGGIAVAWLAGFHRGRFFSITDMLLVVSAFAILIPLIQQIVPESYFVKTVTLDSIKAAIPFALTGGCWCLVVCNLYLRILPEAEHGKTPFQIALGMFLLNAMLSWNHCQFGLIVAAWMLISLLPIFGCEQRQS